METSTDEPDPFTFFVSNELFKKAKAALLSTQPDYSRTLNTVYFGVRELTPPERNMYNETNRPPTPYPITAQINTTFRVRIYSSGCYYISEKLLSAWKTAGCEVRLSEIEGVYILYLTKHGWT